MNIDLTQKTYTNSVWPTENTKTLLQVSREFVDKFKAQFENKYFKLFPANDLICLEVVHVRSERMLASTHIMTFNTKSFGYDSLIKDAMNMLKMLFLLNGLKVETTYKEADITSNSIRIRYADKRYVIYVDDCQNN